MSTASRSPAAAGPGSAAGDLDAVQLESRTDVVGNRAEEEDAVAGGRGGSLPVGQGPDAVGPLQFLQLPVGADQGAGTPVPLADLTLLPPVVPGKFIGLWNNFKAAAEHGHLPPGDLVVGVFLDGGHKQIESQRGSLLADRLAGDR